MACPPRERVLQNTLSGRAFLLYVPPKEYILALKITAGRKKDLEDCAILLPQTKIETPEQAQQLLDRYILPQAQEEHAEQIERSLNKLFKNQ